MSLSITNDRVERANKAFITDVLQNRATKSITEIRNILNGLLEASVGYMEIDVPVLMKAQGKLALFDRGVSLAQGVRSLPGSDIIHCSYLLKGTFKRMININEKSWELGDFEYKKPYPDACADLIDEAANYLGDTKEYADCNITLESEVEDDHDQELYDRFKVIKAFAEENATEILSYVTALRKLDKIFDDGNILHSKVDSAVGRKRKMASIEEACPEIVPYLKQILEADGAPKTVCEDDDANLADLASCMRIKEDC